jgi:predicted acyl esterase
MSPGLDVQRASYRDLKRGRQLLNPEQVYELTLDRLITSNLFKKSHRMRVQISGSFFPNFSRNPQNGDLESTSSKMQKASVRIYHDAEHASRVLLPVVTR